MKNWMNIIIRIFFIPLLVLSAGNHEKVELPERGICAHRGANETHPENTLTAFKEAIRLGAHMIEFDVQMTKDKELVIMHDRTVDRTTNGSGAISNLTLAEIKSFDAGSWKSEDFLGEKVPTFKETLEIMPKNIWLNIHLKGNEELGKAVAEELLENKRIHQGVIACGTDAARGVRKVNSQIMICNMERRGNREEYVEETIKGKFPFIQLLKKRDDNNLKDNIEKLKQNNIKVNYYSGDTEKEVKKLFMEGVDFVLTNRLSEMLEVVESIGIPRKTYRDKSNVFVKPKKW